MKSGVVAADLIPNPQSAIHDQERPRPAAEEDESAAKHLFELSHDVILSLDRVGTILCINQRGVYLSGYSESELRGANVFELLLLPEDRQVAREMLADVLRGKAREYEVRWRTKNGGIIHFDGATVPRLSASREFLSTLCTLRDVTERKCAEEKLRKSEEKYRDLIEISPDAIYVVDANGVCLLGNRAGAELAGIPQEDLVGTPVTDTYLPEERHLFGERLNKLKGERALRFERQFVRKTGEIVPVEVSVSAIRGGYFQAILRDISERTGAEKALRESEERYRVLVEFSPNSICVHRDGRLLYVNPAGVRFFGAPNLEQLVGRSVLDFIHRDSLPVVRERIRQVAAGETAPLIEEKFVTLDGEVRDVEVTSIPIIYEGAGAAQVIIRDITEHKCAVEAVRRSEKQLRDAIETIPAMAFVTRPDGSSKFVNRRWVEYSGLSLADTAGSGWQATVHKDDIEQHLAKWRAALASGEPFENELRHRSAHGEYRWFLIRAMPLRGEQGNILKWYGTLTDIEDRKRTEEELSRQQQRFMDIVNSVEGIVWEADADTFVFSFVSKRAERILGYPVEEWLQQPTFWKDHLHPKDRDWAVQFCAKATAERRSHDFEYRMIAADGRVVWFRDLVTVVVEGGHVRRLRGVMVDMTQRKRAESLLVAEKRLLEMIATGVALEDILNALCLAIEDYQPGTLASVLLLDGTHLKSVAGPNLPESWTQQMEKLPIGPCAGSCGTAAYRKSPVIVSDIATDPLWDVPEHRASALKHGLQASWSNPVLSSEGKVLGTFCMYYRETRNPKPQDLELIELATHLARVAIERDRAAEALRASERVARGQVEALTYSLDVLATAPAPDKFLGEMLRTIGRLLNAQSVILWLLDETNDSLILRAWSEGTNFAKVDPEHPFIKNPSSWKEDPGLRELFFSGAPVACEDVANDPFTSNDLREYLKAGGTKKFLRIPTLVGGRVKGFIGIRHGDRPSYRPEEIELAQALAHQAMLAIQLNEFAERSRQAAVLEERNRLARDIHDTLAQGFTGVIVQLEAADDAIACSRRKEANEHLQRASELARRSLTEARRSVHALRPQALQQENFWEALRGIIKNTTAGTSVHTAFTLTGELRDLPYHWQENLLHIGQEALTNALKYAHPRNFETLLSFDTNELGLEFRDDGDGFDLEDPHDGFGLAGMRERSEQMGGTLKITSARGKGTKITLTLPYNHDSTTPGNDSFPGQHSVRKAEGEGSRVVESAHS
jgi:PAS domain S-box-containing protein